MCKATQLLWWQVNRVSLSRKPIFFLLPHSSMFAVVSLPSFSDSTGIHLNTHVSEFLMDFESTEFVMFSMDTFIN